MVGCPAGREGMPHPLAHPQGSSQWPRCRQTLLFDLYEGLPHDNPLLNNPVFQGLGSLVHAKQPLVAAPPAMAVGVAVGGARGEDALRGGIRGPAEGVGAHQNLAFEADARGHGQAGSDAFLEGWGDVSNYSPVAARVPAASLQVRPAPSPLQRILDQSPSCADLDPLLWCHHPLFF